MSGGVAALGAALFGVFDAEAPAYSQEEGPGGESLTMSGVDAWVREGGLEYWTQSWSGDKPELAGGVETTLRGYALGVDAPLGKGFRLGVAASPGLVASSVSEGRHTTEARLQGARFALRGSWHGEVFHTGLSLSQGRYEAQSVFDNPVAGGGLAGKYDLAQDHVQLRAGARLTWGGIQVAPSLSAARGRAAPRRLTPPTVRCSGPRCPGSRSATTDGRASCGSRPNVGCAGRGACAGVRRCICTASARTPPPPIRSRWCSATGPGC